MAYSWTDIPDGDIDPDSPITTPLMTAYRDNDYALAEGAAGAPSIARIARADPGRLTHISTATLSGAGSVEFTDLSSSYDSYYFMVRGLYVPASAGDYLTMLTSTDNGSSYGTTLYEYHVQNLDSSSASYSAIASTSDNEIILGGQILGTTLAESFSGDYMLSEHSDASQNAKVKGDYQSNTSKSGKVFGYRDAAEAVNAVKFRTTFDRAMTGEITLYGIDKP